MYHPVKEPRHYAGDGKIACMDALRSMLSPSHDPQANLSPTVIYWWGCAFKYLWRWPLKNGVQDVEKCKQCIEYMLEELKNDRKSDA
jgi:hypothetical protein